MWLPSLAKSSHAIRSRLSQSEQAGSQDMASSPNRDTLIPISAYLFSAPANEFPRIMSLSSSVPSPSCLWAMFSFSLLKGFALVLLRLLPSVSVNGIGVTAALTTAPKG